MCILCGALVSRAGAQEPPPLAAAGAPDAPAHIASVDGYATIEHDGASEAALVNMPVVAGDHIRTENGRVEVMFPDGSGIAVAEYTDVEFVTPTRARVIAGVIEHLAATAVDPRSPSAQYLPQELQPYDRTFDQNGSWQYDNANGYVWYPTVASDWQPYYYGTWEPVATYGWTWVGFDRWAWPTHHYGRWGYARSRWFWIPGRTWAPAWVSWASAPGYVSWCPLGFDGRPVFALSVAFGSAHVGRFGGWTVLPRRDFGVRGLPVHPYAIDARRIAGSATFTPHRSAPVAVPAAVRSVAAGVAASRRDGGAASWNRAEPRAGYTRTAPSVSPVAPTRSGPVTRMTAPPVAPMTRGPVAPMTRAPVAPMTRAPVAPMRRGPVTPVTPSTGVAAPRGEMSTVQPRYTPPAAPVYRAPAVPRYSAPAVPIHAPSPPPRSSATSPAAPSAPAGGGSHATGGSSGHASGGSPGHVGGHASGGGHPARGR